MKIKECSIIQYQNVTSRSHLSGLWLSVAAFQRQVDYLSGASFHVLEMDRAVDFMERKPLRAKGRPIALSFDNGYMDFYEHALPLLLRYGFPSTLLISPQRVGVKAVVGGQEVSFLTWPLLRELGSLGVTIGAYEDTSRNINDIPRSVLHRHIPEYKKTLEDRLGREIRYFGVKEGVPDPGIRDRLIFAGYRAFLTECPTHAKPDLYSIGRIQVDDDDFNIFLTKTSRAYLFFKDTRYWKYIREYGLDKMAHRLSETYDKMRGVKAHEFPSPGGSGTRDGVGRTASPFAEK